MSDPAKPASGTVAQVAVPVQNIWQHPTVIVAALMALVPFIIAALVQLKDLPGLPTNVLAWIASAISILTTVFVIWQKLNGLITITPTAAAKLTENQP